MIPEIYMIIIHLQMNRKLSRYEYIVYIHCLPGHLTIDYFRLLNKKNVKYN